jgi:hypothetical protein
MFDMNLVKILRIGKKNALGMKEMTGLRGKS